MSETPHYIHGYNGAESQRLQAQAQSVMDLLHNDTRYPAGSTVLEVGCGTGEQTFSLARNSPEAQFVAVDRSATSLDQARRRVERAGIENVTFLEADLFHLPFEPRSFDHLFVCFVLEHLPAPLDALVLLKTLLKPGGTITVFEGHHGSTYFHPHSDRAHQAIHTVRRAREFIQDCYAERLTLDGVAEAAGVSRYAVLRAFRHAVGIAPYAFVTQVRVEHAKRLLAEGVAIATVAQRVGFADQSHLTRHFKRLLGVTPGAYARGAALRAFKNIPSPAGRDPPAAPMRRHVSHPSRGQLR